MCVLCVFDNYAEIIKKRKRERRGGGDPSQPLFMSLVAPLCVCVCVWCPI
jgi:hypothetical protein